MYDEVHDALVECGVASKINDPWYMDQFGNPAAQSDALEWSYWACFAVETALVFFEKFSFSRKSISETTANKFFYIDFLRIVVPHSASNFLSFF